MRWRPTNAAAYPVPSEVSDKGGVYIRRTGARVRPDSRGEKWCVQLLRIMEDAGDWGRNGQTRKAAIMAKTGLLTLPQSYENLGARGPHKMLGSNGNVFKLSHGDQV